MIATRALGHGRAAELAAEDDQRVVEHIEAFEIFDERGRGLINFPGRDGRRRF